MSLNSLGACIAEKQQSDGNSLSEAQCHHPQGKFQFSP